MVQSTYGALKVKGRAGRVLRPDGSFKYGMRYVESFIPAQTVKLLVNQRVMDSGSYLTPRKGIRGYDTLIETRDTTVETPHTNIPAAQVAYYGVYRGLDGFDHFGNIILSFGMPSDPRYKYGLTEDTDVDDDYYKNMRFSDWSFATMTCDEGRIIIDTGGLLPARAHFYLKEPKPIYTVYNYELYYLGEDAEGNSKILKATVAYDSVSSKYKIVAAPLVAKEVLLSESTSVGFNMLSEDPYAFENVSGIVHSVQGILPYNPADQDKLMLSANVGEGVIFRLYYTYVDNEVYRAKWEIAAYGSTEFETCFDYADATFTNGAEIQIFIKPEHTRSNLRCTMVPLDGAGVQQDTLAKAATFPVYTLGLSDLRDSKSAVYDLHKATGITEHNEMLVLWGVPGVEATVFFSDYLDPTYFPFPQNSFTFPEPIMHVQSFSSSVLIFTARTIYVIEGYYMADMIAPRALFNSMAFEKEDIFAIKAVKNNLLIRSGGTYSLLVPNIYTGAITDARMNYITTPVADLLFGWNSFLKLLSDRLYKLDVSWSEETHIVNYDFFNFVDSSAIKNVYRFMIYENKSDGLHRYQADVTLAYDTYDGMWYTEVASFSYPSIIAQGNKLYSTYIKRGVSHVDLYLQQLSYTNSDCVDTYNTMFYGKAVNDFATNDREAELANYPVTGQDIVVRHVDGDTLDLERLGRVRMHYVNTPESTFTIEPYGKAASNYLKELLPIGSVVTFEFDGPRADRYDRALCWLLKDGVLVQELIAAQGFVKSVYDFEATDAVRIGQVEAAVATALANKVGLYNNLYPEGPFYVRTIQSAELLGNFQILDTGNREHDIYYMKRYKEIQFIVSNDSPNTIAFYVEFYVDSIRRQTPVSYSIEHITDPESADYGTIYISESDAPNMNLSNETALDFWQLDMSLFPELETVKVVFRVSGKGHYPRFILVSRNQDAHKILGYSWVYRTMSAR